MNGYHVCWQQQAIQNPAYRPTDVFSSKNIVFPFWVPTPQKPLQIQPIIKQFPVLLACGRRSHFTLIPLTPNLFHVIPYIPKNAE